MDNKDNFDLEIELTKSIQKLVDEETSVAKAFVDRNSVSQSTQKVSPAQLYNDRQKTQAIPNLPSRKVSVGNDRGLYEDGDPEDFLADDLLESEDESEEYVPKRRTSPTPNRGGRNRKKKMDRKTKWIIAGSVSFVAAAILVIVGIAALVNNSNKNTYTYNFTTGMELYEAKNYEEAIQYLEKAAADNNGKRNIQLKQNLYNCYVGVNEEFKAIELLKDILSYERHNQKALTNLAAYYESKKDGAQLTELLRRYKGTEGEQYIQKYAVIVPTADQEGGSYTDTVDLTLTASGTDRIFYTLDGTEPTTKSTLYSEPIHLVKGDTTVKFIAVNEIGTMSEITEQKYSIDYKAPDAPEITPATGSYDAGQKFEITNLKEGDKAYYTTDGTTPTSASALYTEPFEIPDGNIVISAIIINQYDLESAVTRRNYNIIPIKTYTFDECIELLKLQMKLKDDMNADGTSADGGTTRFVYHTRTKINEVDMFLAEYGITKSGKETMQDYYFGIEERTGKCYKVTGSDGAYTAVEY